MSKERILAIDKLRVVSILGVILIHTTTRVLERTSYDLNSYSSTLFLNQIIRFAVPLFFLISGFVLELTYKEDFNFKTYIQKRFSKVIIPYIFWSLFYYYFIYNINSNNLLYVLLTGNASYQLYFIPALCIFYLLFPILHKLYKFISKPIVLIVLTLLQIRILYYDYFIKNLLFPDYIRISILGIFFFIFGMVASHYKESLIDFSKKWKVFLGIISISLGYYIFREGSSQYFKTFNINGFYSSWRPSTLIYTLVSGTFFLSIFNKVNLQKLSELSFLVFFVHVFVLEFIWKYIGKFVNPNISYDIILFSTVLGISFFIAFVIHKIPHISKLVG